MLKYRKMKNLLFLVFIGITTYSIGQTGNANHYPTEAQHINSLVAKINKEELTTRSYHYFDDYEEEWVLYVSRNKNGNIKKVEFSDNMEFSDNNIYYLDKDQVLLIMNMRDYQGRWINQQINNYYLKNGTPFYEAFRHNYKGEIIEDTGSELNEFTEEHAIPLYTTSKDFEELISKSKLSE